MVAATSPSHSESLEVASEVLSYCTSCKMDLNHVIVALKGERIMKVQCLTCKKEHAFRVPKGAKSPQKKRASKPQGTESSAATRKQEELSHSIEAEWEKLMSDHKNQPFKTYSAHSHFALGDKLKHANFGDGIVAKLIYPNKLEVLFRTNIKILMHAGSVHTIGNFGS